MNSEKKIAEKYCQGISFPNDLFHNRITNDCDYGASEVYNIEKLCIETLRIDKEF